MKRLVPLALGAFIAAPAFAGGPVAVAPEPYVEAPAQAYVASGNDWTGFYAGGSLGYADIESDPEGLDGDGLIGGVLGGYRYDFGKAVIGAELDYDFADIDLGDDLGSLDNVGRVKLMAGYDFGSTLVYGTIGKAYAEAEVGGEDLSGDGEFIGIGADYALSDNLTVGGEYLVHSFDDFDDSGVDLDVDTIKARVAFNF